MITKLSINEKIVISIIQLVCLFIPLFFFSYYALYDIYILIEPNLLNPFGDRLLSNILFLFFLFSFFLVGIIVYFIFLFIITTILWFLPFKLNNALEIMWDNYRDEISYKGISYTKRQTISQAIKDKVWNRDGGKCVQCGSNEKLEFDHIIPHSKGGANTYRNLQLLCEPCNRSKSAKIG